MPLETGAILTNRYRIEEAIAVGGMGAIYRATDDTLGIRVAVKENFFSTTEFSRQFRREATILASLRHPNLPRVTDHFVIQDQGQYLVMDFIEGDDLRQIITQQGSLPEAQVARMGITICDALAYLHTRNPSIVHRDIKPGNIKITPTGQVILVDFGLAKLSRGEATTTGAQALTPGYAPPEQYGQGTEPRSDIYALGATLYAALTGKIPEDGLSRAMGTVELTPIRRYNPLVSEQIARVIEKAMAVRPDDRYQDAEQFESALETCLQQADAQAQAPAPHPSPTLIIPNENSQTIPKPNAGVLASSTGANPAGMAAARPAAGNLPGAAKPLAKPGRRFAVLPVLLGAGGLALIGGLVIVVVSLLNGTPGFLPQPSATWTAVPDTATPTFAPPSATPTLAPSATATTAPSNTPAPPTGTPAPALPTTTFTPAPTLAGGGGQMLAFASNRSGIAQVWLTGPDGKDPQQITNLADGACQPSWSPDGKRLVFISPCNGFFNSYGGASLFIINADGTGLLPLVSLPGGDFDPSWSPDGNTIAFTSLRDGIPHIYLYNLADQSVIRLSSLSNYEQQPCWSADGTRIAYQTTRAGQPQVWTMAPDGSDPKEFSKLTGGSAYSPDWSPDNGTMIYTQATNQRWLIARQTDNPTAGEFKVSERVRPVYDPDFSPDGWWIAFATTQEGNLDIYRMQRNGGEQVRLTDDPGDDFHPAWRP